MMRGSEKKSDEEEIEKMMFASEGEEASARER